jgi:hypothetical protein
MSDTSALYSYTHLPGENILLLKLKPAAIDKDTASAIYDGYSGEKELPDFSDFIMDASSVTEISNPAIGILMKSLSIMKKAKGYLVLVLNDAFLQKIMVEHPEMFNYLAVFNSIDEAKTFIAKSRK